MKLLNALFTPQGQQSLLQSIMAARFRISQRMALRRKSYLTGEDIATAYQRTITADCWRRTATEQTLPTNEVVADAAVSLQTLKAAYDAFYHYFVEFDHQKRIHLDTDQDNTDSAGSWERVKGFCDSVVRVAYARKLFATKKGYLALGPPSTRVGDRIVALFGGQTPYVPRQVRK